MRLVGFCAMWRLYMEVPVEFADTAKKKIHGPGSGYAGLTVVVILSVCLSIRSAS